jgi:hypothetical protein
MICGCVFILLRLVRGVLAYEPKFKLVVVPRGHRRVAGVI